MLKTQQQYRVDALNKLRKHLKDTGIITSEEKPTSKEAPQIATPICESKEPYKIDEKIEGEIYPERIPF